MGNIKSSKTWVAATWQAQKHEGCEKCGWPMPLISPVARSAFSTAFHSYQPMADFTAASSERALCMVRGGFASFHQLEIRPQRTLTSSISDLTIEAKDLNDLVRGDVEAARERIFCYAGRRARNVRSRLIRGLLSNRTSIYSVRQNFICPIF